MAKPVISTNLPGVRREFGEDNGVVYVERPEDVVPKVIELVESGRLAEKFANPGGTTYNMIYNF